MLILTCLTPQAESLSTCCCRCQTSAETLLVPGALLACSGAVTSRQQLLQRSCCAAMLPSHNVCVLNLIVLFLALPQKKKSDPLDDYWCACVLSAVTRAVSSDMALACD